MPRGRGYRRRQRRVSDRRRRDRDQYRGRHGRAGTAVRQDRGDQGAARRRGLDQRAHRRLSAQPRARARRRMTRRCAARDTIVRPAPIRSSCRCAGDDALLVAFREGDRRAAQLAGLAGAAVRRAVEGDRRAPPERRHRHRKSVTQSHLRIGASAFSPMGRSGAARRCRSLIAKGLNAVMRGQLACARLRRIGRCRMAGWTAFGASRGRWPQACWRRFCSSSGWVLRSCGGHWPSWPRSPSS